MKWKEIPKEARKYMWYHIFVSPLLISWYLLPVYLMVTGYNVLEVGIIFTAVQIISLPLTYLSGKIFSKMDVRKGLAMIDVLEGTSNLLFGFSAGNLEVPLVLSGMVIDDLAGALYPLYQVAEKILYPKETLEKVFSWHIGSAEISQMIGFLVLGYVFTYVLGSPGGFRIGFLAIGVCSFILAAYILLFLPELGKEQISVEEKKKFKVDREFRLILLFEGLLVLGWSLAPEIVLINYVLKVLHGTFFQIMLIMAGTSLASIIATYLSENISKERGAIPLFSGYLMVAVQYGIMTGAPSFYSPC